jgi:hypothetical protein
MICIKDIITYREASRQGRTGDTENFRVWFAVPFEILGRAGGEG